MTKEEILSMAREAGATPYTNRHYPDRQTNTFNPEQLGRFAALVAEKEREACAKVCEQYKGYGGNLFAPAIRARGQK
jgi:hypothetical protein